jgi:hypothetical protein
LPISQSLEICLVNPVTFDWVRMPSVMGSVPAWSAANNMIYIADAGPGVTGIAAGVVGLRVTSNCTLQVAWSNALGAFPAEHACALGSGDGLSVARVLISSRALFLFETCRDRVLRGFFLLR